LSAEIRNEYPILAKIMQLGAVGSVFAYNPLHAHRELARLLLPLMRGRARERYGDPERAMSEDERWVRGVIAEFGYDGPLAEACCPLRDWLLERGEAAPLRVIAAAILGRDGVVHFISPPGRHHDVMQVLGLPQARADEQGFLLSDGRYARRDEAMRVARAAGQLLNGGAADGVTDLYSEDLWSGSIPFAVGARSARAPRPEESGEAG
jgi:hypothetical protein